MNISDRNITIRLLSIFLASADEGWQLGLLSPNKNSFQVFFKTKMPPGKNVVWQPPEIVIEWEKNNYKKYKIKEF